MGYYTDAAIRELLPDAANLSSEQVKQAARDAATVYEHVQSHPGITAARLRKWGENATIDPDRMNVALQILTDAGKLHSLPDVALAAISAGAEPRASRSAGRRRSKGSHG